MHQIIISQSGLSVGEIETINSLFSDYIFFENKIEFDFEYASVIEVEFFKNKNIRFFDFISIEKWTLFIDIVKNIKKRRGKKGLKFKVMITDFHTSKEEGGEEGGEEKEGDGEGGKEDTEGEDNEPIFFIKKIFLLKNKNDLEFNKGLERIEITIENLDELYFKLHDGRNTDKKEAKEIAEECKHNRPKEFQETDNNRVGIIQSKMIHDNPELMIFIFDDKKRVWKTL